MNFKAIAERKLCGIRGPTKYGKCPDQYVGQLALIEKAGAFTTRMPAIADRITGSRILLILESPHTAEFEGEPGPAKGKTGESIVKYLRSVNGLDSFGGHGLILINAVQYQCSLGYRTAEYRDSVFTEMWNSGGRDDFISRLQRIYSKDDLLINCCTKGRFYPPINELRSLVQSAIQQAVPQASVMRRNHPSSWHFSARRQRNW